jgi:hypothetical protein
MGTDVTPAGAVRDAELASAGGSRTCAGPYCSNPVKPNHRGGQAPKFCGTNCRSAHYRREKRARDIEQAKQEHEAYLYKLSEQHRTRWIDFLMEHNPPSKRSPKLHRQHCEELFTALMEHDMIDKPYQQRRFF